MADARIQTSPTTIASTSSISITSSKETPDDEELLPLLMHHCNNNIGRSHEYVFQEENISQTNQEATGSDLRLVYSLGRLWLFLVTPLS